MSRRNSNKHISIPALLALVFIMLMAQACDKKTTPTTPPPPTDQDAQGLYTTNGPVKAIFANPVVEEDLNQIKGMVYGSLPNQKFIFFDVTSNVLYDGVISAITLTAVTGTATVYHDGVKVSANVAVTGTVTSSSSISLTFATTGDYTGGTIEGLYNSSYDQVATKKRIQAVVVDKWLSGNRAGFTKGSGIIMAISDMETSNFSISFLVDNSYSYFSNTVTASVQCGHAGTLTIGTPKNIYTLLGETVTATTNCTITNSPVYKGFASIFTVDGAGKGTEMWYASTNGTNSIFAILVRP